MKSIKAFFVAVMCAFFSISALADDKIDFSVKNVFDGKEIKQIELVADKIVTANFYHKECPVSTVIPYKQKSTPCAINLTELVDEFEGNVPIVVTAYAYIEGKSLPVCKFVFYSINDITVDNSIPNSLGTCVFRPPNTFVVKNKQ